MIYFLCLFVIPTKNLLFSDFFNCIHFLKFNSSINFSFFGSSDNSIKCLPYFEKMALSQFKVYIEAEKITQYIVCNNCNMSIFIPSSNVKEGVFYILHMLIIHAGLQRWNKKDRFHIILRDMNPLGIKQPCVTIANNEVLFENIELLLSGTNMQLILTGKIQSIVTDYLSISC